MEFNGSEVLYEDEKFQQRELAALVASKVSDGKVSDECRFTIILVSMICLLRLLLELDLCLI